MTTDKHPRKIHVVQSGEIIKNRLHVGYIRVVCKAITAPCRIVNVPGEYIEGAEISPFRVPINHNEILTVGHAIQLGEFCQPIHVHTESTQGKNERCWPFRIVSTWHVYAEQPVHLDVC